MRIRIIAQHYADARDNEVTLTPHIKANRHEITRVYRIIEVDSKSHENLQNFTIRGICEALDVREHDVESFTWRR